MNTTPNNSHSREEQNSAPKANQIKLGLDVHADSIVVVRQLDGQNPQPPQKFAPTEFLDWVRTQLTRAVTVHSCYEAGAFGYGLHRHLTELGVRNLVVAPPRLDERHTGVKTDKTDARALVLKLDSPSTATTTRWPWCACRHRPRSNAGPWPGSASNSATSGADWKRKGAACC